MQWNILNQAWLHDKSPVEFLIENDTKITTGKEYLIQFRNV